MRTHDWPGQTHLLKTTSLLVTMIFRRGTS